MEYAGGPLLQLAACRWRERSRNIVFADVYIWDGKPQCSDTPSSQRFSLPVFQSGLYHTFKTLTTAISGSGTYGIKGLSWLADAITRAHKEEGGNNSIPYVEGLPVRHEISALANSKDLDYGRQWTLFVLALEKFKLKPVEDKLSYFQIAGTFRGIHAFEVNTVGGSEYENGVGYIGEVPVAPFDSIFRPHHIDRLLAMSQSLNWQRWFGTEGLQCEEGETKCEENVRDNKPDYRLYHFHYKDNGDPNTDIVFNYQYDDLMDLPKKVLNEDKTLDENEFRRLLRGYINKVYSCTENLIWSIDETSGMEIPKNLRSERPGLGNHNNLCRYALGSRFYTIRLFLGGRKNEKRMRYEPQNYVGSVNTFGGGDFKDVGEYLKLHLRWKVVAFGGVKLEEKDLGPFQRTKNMVYRGIGKPQHVPAEAEELKNVSISALEGLVTGQSVDFASAATNGAGDVPQIALPPT
ncbi:hypothetical protein EDB80DRAFT_689403 [Ilyonectria destructans]|nr:hypothetical protein EDB80DRAFT_689403 [Ilyonectria destructans]